MPISSLIVRTSPNVAESVSGQLASHPAISVENVSAGAIAIITETPEDAVDKALWKQIEAMDGVTHVELIYHNFEDLEGRDHATK